MKCPYCEETIHTFCNGEVWTDEQIKNHEREAEERKKKVEEIRKELGFFKKAHGFGMFRIIAILVTIVVLPLMLAIISPLLNVNLTIEYALFLEITWVSLLFGGGFLLIVSNVLLERQFFLEHPECKEFKKYIHKA